MENRTHDRIRSQLSHRAAVALIAALFLLFGARCAQTGESGSPPPEAAAGAQTGSQGTDDVTSAGGEMEEDAGPLAKNVVVYFAPDVEVSVEGLAFAIRPAAGSGRSAEEVAEQAKALNARLARSGAIELSPIFSPDLAEAAGEDLAPGFDVALPADASEADALALVADLSESPLVDEAYLSAVGSEPGVGEPGLP